MEIAILMIVIFVFGLAKVVHDYFKIKPESSRHPFHHLDLY